MTKRVLWGVIVLLLCIIQIIKAQPATLYQYVWSQDGSRLVIATMQYPSYVVTVYDAEWQPLASRELPCCGFSLSPNGKELLTNSDPSEILESDTLQPLRTLSSQLGAAAWSPDGSELAVYDVNPHGGMKIYSATDGSLLRDFTGPNSAFAHWPDGPSWSPGGAYFVAGFRNRLVLLDAKTGTQVGQTLDPDGNVEAYSWSSDSRKVALSLRKQVATEVPGSFPTGDSIGSYTVYSIVVLDIATGKIRSLKSGFRSPATPLVWNPDDTQLATYLDGSLTILDSESGATVSSYPPTFNSIIIGYSPWGGRLLTGLATDQPFTVVSPDLATSQSVQTSLNGLIQIFVPNPSSELLASIEAECVPAKSLSSLPEQEALTTQTADLSAYIETVKADAAIPPACAADLIAVAEALQGE